MQPRSLYEFSHRKIDGHPFEFSSLRGFVVLIVNTASQCGFTPQYQGLEELHQEFFAQGLRVIGVPCNQFGGQEPGNHREIAHFCQLNYGVTFTILEKLDVNGPDAHPLFRYLTDALPGLAGTRAIKWNFTKFLIDRAGCPVQRYSPQTAPKKLAPHIQSLVTT